MLRSMRPLIRSFPILLVLCLVPSVAQAWSYKEHTQFARLAAEHLLADPQTPPAMKDWLKSAAPGTLDEAGEKEYFLHTHVGTNNAQFQGLIHYATVPDDHA